MAIRRYAELECDHCGSCDHYGIGERSTEEQARSMGWIITKNRKHYCLKKCYNASRIQPLTPQPHTTK